MLAVDRGPRLIVWWEAPAMPDPLGALIGRSYGERSHDPLEDCHPVDAWLESRDAACELPDGSLPGRLPRPVVVL